MMQLYIITTYLASCLALTLADIDANFVPLPGEESRIN
jgi:hypothetical protein